MGLEQKEEPAEAWWIDHRLLVLWWGSFLKLLMLVVGGWCLRWWVEQQWRHCSLRFQGLSLESVSMCCLCRMTGSKWNLRCRIRGNKAPNLRPRGLLAFYFPSLWRKYVSVLFLILAQVKLVIEIECKMFILTARRWNIRSSPYKMWVLHAKNKWPLCHAWHHAHMNCSNSWCFSWAQT